MPEQPARRIFGFTWGSSGKVTERLATPEELAEYGAAVPDPKTEAQILALFEKQLVEGLVEQVDLDRAEKEQTLRGSGTTAVELTQPNSEMVPEPPIERASSGPTGNVEEVEVTATASPEPEDESERTSVEACSVVEESAEEAAGTSAALELVPESRAAAGNLLELAVALDQHKLWVESRGKEGTRGEFVGAALAEVDLTGVNLQAALLQKANLRGSDLSLCNLRNANLVEADLRDTNLLGAEFSGANLMGANLYGAQGLWSGRLAGTNLFDAALPEAVAALNGSKTIEQFTQAARWFYLLVMALSVCACALIGSTTDVRLLLDESAIGARWIPNLLPLHGFFLGAPLLLTAMHLRLQFLLLRLWGSMGALPAVFPDGQTPEKDGRWYLMGPIRPHLKWSRNPRSPLGLVESYVAMLLAYGAVPVALFFFWLRYLVMQDYRGTLLHVFLFTVASAAACGMPKIVARVLRPGDWTEETTPQFVHDVLKALGVPAAVGCALFLFSLGVIRGLPADAQIRPEVKQGDPRRWAATAFQSVGYRPYASITDERMWVASAPAGGGAPGAGAANEPRLNEINLRFARGYQAAFAGARMWRANLEGANLAEADFRGANLREAVLRSAKMDHLRAEKSNLVSVDARWAGFDGGDFRGADLSYSNLEGASLTTANLAQATLYAANLRQANLLRAELSHADLRDARLEDAIVALAKLEQADLSSAKMTGANLTGIEAKGTIFLEADLSRADLRGGTFAGAILRQVRLDGARLEGADLRGALGLEAWQVCAATGWRGAQLDPDVKLAAEQSCGGPPANPHP